MGNYPDATAVFDVDAIGLVNIVRNLNRGLDLGGNTIGKGTGFVIGVGANPGLPNLDEEIRRFEYKVEAGKTVTWRYRYYFHAGDEKQSKVAEHYADYVKATAAK